MIVDLNVPRFFGHQSIPIDGLNSDQQKAIDAVTSAQDYALILGMPGTGKTTTIMKIVQILASMNKRVLLTAYTHTDVDNILLKLKQAGVDFIRLGNNLEKV